MSKEVKLVAESLQDWENKGDVDNLNEGAKKSLVRFIKDPSKKDSLAAAYARQMGKTKGLKNVLLKMSDEAQVQLAKQSYAAMEKNPKLGYPWLKITNNKIVAGGALPVKKGALGSELGA